MIDNIKLKELSDRNSVCPSQWEGKTVEGDDIYVRYRYGSLSVRKNGNTIFHKGIGDSLDGVLDTEEMLEHTGMILKKGGK